MLAEAAAREAGGFLVERFRRPASGVGAKSSATDLVSDADRNAEALLRERLLGARPDDAILGEEGGEDGGRSGLRWVVDPLDGTVNYLFGIPQWAVSVACEDADGSVVGVVHDPLRGETFSAARGCGARLNGTVLRASDAGELQTALIATGFSYRAATRAVQARVLEEVLPRVRDIRRAGSAALDLAAVAAGRVDGFYETGTSHWDSAAGLLLVTEAGGAWSEFDGGDAAGDGLVAAGARLHASLRRLILDAHDRSVRKNSLH
jgi:myo-inositol-1(or 4)-monophosphatase